MKKVYVILAVAALLCVAACGNKKKAECKECEKCEEVAEPKDETVKEAAEAAAEDVAKTAINEISNDQHTDSRWPSLTSLYALIPDVKRRKMVR